MSTIYWPNLINFHYKQSLFTPEEKAVIMHADELSATRPLRCHWNFQKCAASSLEFLWFSQICTQLVFYSSICHREIEATSARHSSRFRLQTIN